MSHRSDDADDARDPGVRPPEDAPMDEPTDPVDPLKRDEGPPGVDPVTAPLPPE